MGVQDWVKKLAAECNAETKSAKRTRSKRSSQDENLHIEASSSCAPRSYGFAPFKSWSQWTQCRALLFSKKLSDRRQGIRICESWQRLGGGTATVPVNATVAILRAKILDECAVQYFQHDNQRRHTSDLHDSTDGTSIDFLTDTLHITGGSSEIIRMAYSMAIIRLVNSEADMQPISNLASSDRTSVKQRAQASGIPIELVHVRHEATHGELPSIQRLRFCAALSLRHLWDKYWMVQYNAIQSELEEEKESKNVSNRHRKIPRAMRPTARDLCVLFDLPEDCLDQDNVQSENGDLLNTLTNSERLDLTLKNTSTPNEWPATPFTLV